MNSVVKTISAKYFLKIDFLGKKIELYENKMNIGNFIFRI